MKLPAWNLGFWIGFGLWILGVPSFAQNLTLINYPNPFNPKGGQIVTFECFSNSNLETSIYLYDMAARLLWKKNFPLQAATKNRISWDGYNENNELVGNGIYLYRLIDSSSKQQLAKGKIWVINR